MSNKDIDYYFIRGGGEMGELIRAKDWSKTSLGDPADWPQSLRTMVAVMLDNPFGMYIAWGNDYIQIYNDGYRPILGATKHPQALGISTRETFAEIWHIIGSMFKGVMNGKAVGFPDFMLPLNRNGFVEKCYFDFSYSPIRKDDGKVGGVLVTVTETTNRKKADEALKESEARFRAIADDAPVFIFLAGENAAVEYLNKTWREYTGISTEDSKGRAWAEITHPDDVDHATKIYMDGFNKRESCSFENRQKGTDGIYRTILWKATPRFSLNGQFIGMMGVGFDIHERKKSEDKLRESEQQFNTLANNIQNLAWIADAEGYIYWYNQRWYDYTGTTLEEMKGWGWEKVHHPDYLNGVVDFVKTAWQVNQPFELTFPLRGANGEYRWFLTRAFPVCDEVGKISNWIGTNTDITEQKSFAEQLEIKVEERTAELNNKNEELEQLNKKLQSFAYISSHDLQEPLRKIQTFATRIIEKEVNNLSDNGKDVFNRMQKAAHRMQTLIQDLLTYSRTNTEERKFENTNLNRIVDEVREDLLEELTSKHATIETTVLCEANTIPFQFRQLMHNLIGNSLKFANPKRPPHIKIESKIAKGSEFNNDKLLPENKYCLIIVTDNGIGFEQQYNEKIFEIFQRLHGKNDYDGTGIGLSIVKKIVENHHGIITATGELHKGATFEIYIPVT